MDGTVIDNRENSYNELRHFSHALVLASYLLLSKKQN